MKLWDVENYEYPNIKTLEESFRTVQVFQCGICGALTNLVVRRNDPGLGVQPICPNRLLFQHDLAKSKTDLNLQPHPRFYKKEMLEEINDIKEKFFNNLPNDLAGKPDRSKILPFK